VLEVIGVEPFALVRDSLGATASNFSVLTHRLPANHSAAPLPHHQIFGRPKTPRLPTNPQLTNSHNAEGSEAAQRHRRWLEQGSCTLHHELQIHGLGGRMGRRNAEANWSLLHTASHPSPAEGARVEDEGSPFQADCFRARGRA